MAGTTVKRKRSAGQVAAALLLLMIGLGALFSGDGGWAVAFLVFALAMFFYAPPERRPIAKTGEQGAVRCPRCGSPQIHAEKRGWNMWTGFLGSGTIVITCLACGQRFKPGQG